MSLCQISTRSLPQDTCLFCNGDLQHLIQKVTVKVRYRRCPSLRLGLQNASRFDVGNAADNNVIVTNDSSCATSLSDGLQSQRLGFYNALKMAKTC